MVKDSKAMIKLIVSDMDGTLLDENHIINDEFWTLFAKLSEKGIIFVAASGRQYHNLVNIFQRIKEDIYIVAENGTYVVHQEQELFLDALSKKDVKQLIHTARKLTHATLVLCGKKSAYVETEDEFFLAEIGKYYDKCQRVDDFLTVDDEILKLAICDLTGTEQHSLPMFADLMDDYKVVVSGKIWLDISKKSANKGVAIKKLQQILNITPEQTMVFGDYMNDAEMLEDAYYSFAMADAHPELKKKARYLAGSNNENGVVKAIKAFVF